MSLRGLLTTALALLAACGTGGDESTQPDDLASVLLVTIDTLRADHLGAYGYREPTTPFMDDLALRGVLFETVYAPMGTTAPAHASAFTSKHPLGLGLTRNGFALAEGERTLAEVLKDRGYDTAAFVSSYPLKSRFGFAQGFDVYDDEFDPTTASFVQKHWEGQVVEGGFDRTGDLTRNAALSWLAQRSSNRPLFMWIHFFDPHFPYAAPSRYASLFRAAGQSQREREIANYDAEVRFVDGLVETVVRAFDHATKPNPPLVALVGDHGEGLYDHGYRTHNQDLYDEELRVPFLLRWKGQLPEGVRVARPVHLVDVAPTLLSLLGLEAESEGAAGVDLAPAWRGAAGDLDADRPVWLQRPHYEQGRPHLGLEGTGLRRSLGELEVSGSARRGTSRALRPQPGSPRTPESGPVSARQGR